MSKAVIYHRFGGPEVLEIVEVPEPHAAAHEVRVRVTAAGLNPMDWQIAAAPEMARSFGISLPAGFGSDFAGVIDEVGSEVTDYAPGQRVFGYAIGRSVAEFVVTDPSRGNLWQTPDPVGDEVASTLAIAGATASAVVNAIGVGASDTVLVGGAAGGVGVLVVQLSKLAGARVIGTCSRGTFDFVRGLGAEPVEYGAGLGHRLGEQWPGAVTAAADLKGTETAETALEIGVSRDRIAMITVGPTPPEGVQVTGGFSADPNALNGLAAAVASNAVIVPIAATFPIEQIVEAVNLQASGHVHGKITITI